MFTDSIFLYWRIYNIDFSHSHKDVIDNAGLMNNINNGYTVIINAISYTFAFLAMTNQIQQALLPLTTCQFLLNSNSCLSLWCCQLPSMDIGYSSANNYSDIPQIRKGV